MRRQLLLQQFLNGLRDKQAKFAVEYFKEPGSIEDAVHNVVTYMEAQQGPKFDDSRNRNHSKSVRFLTGSADGDEADDDSSDDDGFGNRANISGPLSSSSGHREKQIVRKVQTAPFDSSIVSQFLNYLATAVTERETCHDSTPNNSQVTHRSHDQLPRQGQLRPQNQNTGQIPRQGQSRPNQQGQGQSASPNRLANIQCYHCSNFGHLKRDCPVLRAEQNLNGFNESQIHVRAPHTTQAPVYPQNIALN